MNWYDWLTFFISFQVNQIEVLKKIEHRIFRFFSLSTSTRAYFNSTSVCYELYVLMCHDHDTARSGSRMAYLIRYHRNHRLKQIVCNCFFSLHSIVQHIGCVELRAFIEFGIGIAAIERTSVWATEHSIYTQIIKTEKRNNN